ncbi:hypothetical protein ALC57_17796 [Trachymyrmex cornetzi]|uniref:Uncharacterized protein n=1 Tax=Trachymyrmex cornetzi TaxID=471704 RepID=A0A195DB60_9HYME|nr:hypothetical protein ALC57_17796 [Trachymyrmex cornetzi]
MCIRLLRSRTEIRIIRERPRHISLWNAITGKFEQLEALKSNNTTFYSVNAVNELRGKRLIVANGFCAYWFLLTQFSHKMHPYIINVKKNEVTGFIEDVWIFEKTLKFKHTVFVQSESVIDAKWCYINSYRTNIAYGWHSFICIICTACSIVGIYRLKKLVCADYEESDDELSSLSFNLLYVLGFQENSQCERKFEGLIKYLGFQKIPRSLSLRLIILSSLVTGMLMTYVFSSTPISCLANKGHSISLTNLEDMVKKGTHSLCIRNDSTAYVYFTMIKIETKKIYKYNTNCCIRIFGDWKGLLNYAYLETSAVFLTIYHRIQHECNIVQLPNDYWSVRLAFRHARAAQHRKLIDS